MRTLNSRTASTPSSCWLVPPGVMLFSAAPVNSTPFKRKIFCCGRFPSTAKLLPLVELETPMPPVFSQVKFTTPGFSVSNSSKLRPFSGRSLTCCSPTRFDAGEVVALTMAASVFTVTSWLDWPTFKLMSTVALCPTAN